MLIKISDTDYAWRLKYLFCNAIHRYLNGDMIQLKILDKTNKSMTQLLKNEAGSYLIVLVSVKL